MSVISATATKPVPTSLSRAAAPPAARTSSNPTPGSFDALADMRPAMDAANAIGRPTDATGAAGILATSGSYLQGATSTLAKLDDGIVRKQAQLRRLEQVDPAAALKGSEQLDLLQRLRDRIQLSIDRVSDTLAGVDRDDIGGPEAEIRVGDPRAKVERDSREDIELLEQRRRLLGAGGFEAATSPDTPTVAGTYGVGAGSAQGAITS